MSITKSELAVAGLAARADSQRLTIPNRYKR